MAMDTQGDRQGKVWLLYDEVPRSPGHAFYDRLQKELQRAGFDRFVEGLCEPHYAQRGRPSIPPGRYFRMHLVGYFEGLHSERGIEWRCADSLSLREFLLLDSGEKVPDHSTLSRTRARLPLEVHQQVFAWVLKVLAKAELLVGGRIGVDASTMEANAAMRTIVRKDTGEDYQQMLTRLARESGVDAPAVADRARLDRKRAGKKVSNEDWASPTDPEARIARMKDGRTRLGYKPEHALDLDTGAIVAAEIHPADRGDTKTLGGTLKRARENLGAAMETPPPSEDDPAELVADKGYHSRAVLKDLDGTCWRARIAEKVRRGLSCWHGDHAARRAVYNNRTRQRSGVSRWLHRLRTELLERSFAHVLERGGMRRTWLRGLENVQKRYLIHVAGYNLGLLMRKLIGFGTPRGAAEALAGLLALLVAVWMALGRAFRGRRDDRWQGNMALNG